MFSYLVKLLKKIVYIFRSVDSHLLNCDKNSDSKSTVNHREYSLDDLANRLAQNETTSLDKEHKELVKLKNEVDQLKKQAEKLKK